MRRDKSWRNGLARKTSLAVLEAMSGPLPKKPQAAAPKSTLELAGARPSLATDPVLDSYRRRLSMVMF